MLVQVKSAPRGLDLNNLVQAAVVHLCKGIIVHDARQALMDIRHGDDGDIEKLKTKMGVTVEKIK